jgi:hypothetical protein
MSKLWQTLTSFDQPVMTPLLEHVELDNGRRQGPFEVLVRHLLDRLLSNESLGADDETATRITQLAYAIALPGLVVALFLDPLYHSPLGPRLYWSQVSDHCFYVTYSFVVMGLGTVLQWDLLFPDQLDVFILTSLPIARSKLLLGRIAALTIFFGCILLGANLPGWAGFTLAADLRDAMFAHPAAHAVAVLAAGLFVSAFLVALQGVFICGFGQQVARRLSPIVQAVCVLLLLTTLFLFPLLSHFLDALLSSNSGAVFWFPPFWFLGLYERLLRGNATAPVFVTLARIAVRATTVAIIVALATYPLAYARRVRQVVEGVGMRNQGAHWRPFRGLLHMTLLREPRRRAIFNLIGQTVWRTQRLRLLLAVFGGLGLAMTISSALLVRISRGSLSFELSPYGMRLAIPVMAFWTVAGLRAAFRTPVAEQASWIFWAIHGRAKIDHLRAAEIWMTTCTSIVTLSTAIVLHVFAPAGFRGAGAFLFQMLIAVAASVLLTDVFFLGERAIPFTKAQTYSVSNLSFVVITYFVLFPAFALGLVAAEPWMEASRLHLGIATVCAAAIHVMLGRIKVREVNDRARTLEMDEVILRPGEMGLRS